MRTESVTLRHLRTGPPVVVAMAEPAGRDEISINGVDTRSAVDLIGRLVPDGSGIEPAHLTASDRDALLAALHRRCWGDRIVATLTCAACEHEFDLSFELSALQRALAVSDGSWRAVEGRVVHADGRSFLVPFAAEELAAAAHGPMAGAASLAAISGAPAASTDEAAAALEAAAPIVDLDLDASCADCGHAQRVHFDLQSFVLQRLLDERETLMAEVHVLATVYGWSLDEILALPRAIRRSFSVMAGETRARPPVGDRRGGRA